jgi:hypothetical protein
MGGIVHQHWIVLCTIEGFIDWREILILIVK